MDGSPKTGRVFQLLLFCASVALIFTGCATTASYRPEIDSMKTAIAEAKAADGMTRAPEELAAAEACLDWFTHEATEFNPFADPDARIRGKCQAAFAALREKMTAVPVPPPVTPQPEVAAPEAKAPAEAVSPPVTPQPEAARGERAAEEMVSPLKDVFFDYDKSSIRADMKKSLNENIQWLKANPTASIIIEGHCDERGTREYNLALGERRAKSVMNYLVATGINAKRIKVISYGKEQPFAPGHDESAWKLNRRAHFVLQ